MSIIFDVIDIEEKIGVQFKDKSLLKTAFTHSSFANEKKISSNENLEFLGDSILNFVVAEFLIKKHPDKAEGELSKMRANMVSAKPLHMIIEKLNVGDHLFLGVGEAKNSKNRVNIYADLFESIVAAIYLDKDMQTVKNFILKVLCTSNSLKEEDVAFIDYKTKLQEFVQKVKGNKLKYELIQKKGPDHCPEFAFSVMLNDKEIGKGEGKSKKDAQQNAAESACKKLSVQL